MKYGTAGYLNCDKGILMLEKDERKDDPNSKSCALPGGKLKDFEKGLDNPQGRLESCVREVGTETGIKLINPLLKGLILFDNSKRIFDNWENPDDFYVYYYSAKKCSGKLKRSNEGVPFWASLEKIDSLPKNEGDELIYEWLKDGRYFIGVIKHKGEELDEAGTFVDYF